MIREITGYTTSKDYALLVNLMKTQSIICIVDYIIPGIETPIRDIAHTHYEKDKWYYIDSRGNGYITASNEEQFVVYCKSRNVEFLIPDKTEKVGDSK